MIETPHVSDEMREHCQHFIDYVNEWRSGPLVREAIEVTLEHPTYPEFGGTADWIGILDRPKARLMVIADFKYGLGRVEARENTQLLCYAALASAIYGPCDQYIGAIVQPRTSGPPVDEWQFSRAELSEFLDRLHWAFTNRDAYVPGASCVYCPALTHCSALQTATLRSLGEEIAPGDISRWLELWRLKPAIEKLIARVPEELLSELKSGRKIPGLKAVARHGHRKWIGDQQQVLTELRRRGLRKKDIVEERLISPAQLEKQGLLGVAEDLVGRGEIGHSVVDESDRRPAVEFETLDQMFPDLDLEILK